MTVEMDLEERPERGWLAQRPWIWVVIAFLVLISAWSVLITIAVTNQPEKIPEGSSGYRPPSAETES